MKLSEDSSIIDWVIEYPLISSLLDEKGIDYSCAGRSLATACEDAGQPPEEIIKLLVSYISEHYSEPDL